jgi:hypothetical protein
MNPPSSPPPAGPSTSVETPSRSRRYASNQYLTGVLDEARSIVVEDFGDVPTLSVDSFIEGILPPVGEADLTKVKALLVKSKHINKKNQWNVFNRDPKQSGRSEAHAFKGLPTIFNNVVKAASSILKNSRARLHFVYKPNDAPASERNNDTRPDGQLELTMKKSLGKLVSHQLRSIDEKSRWEDIVVPFELKLDEKDYLDVRLFLLLVPSNL